MRERKIDLSSPDYFFRSKRRDLLLPLMGPVVSDHVLRCGTMSGDRKQIPFYLRKGAACVDTTQPKKSFDAVAWSPP